MTTPGRTTPGCRSQNYLDAEDSALHGVPMPPELIARVQAFVDRHHVDEPFYKRKRQRYDPNEAGFGSRPPDSGRKGNGRG